MRLAGQAVIDAGAVRRWAWGTWSTAAGTMLRRVLEFAEASPRARLGTASARRPGPAEAPIPEPCLFERKNTFMVLWDAHISYRYSI